MPSVDQEKSKPSESSSGQARARRGRGAVRVRGANRSRSRSGSRATEPTQVSDMERAGSSANARGSNVNGAREMGRSGRRNAVSAEERLQQQQAAMKEQIEAMTTEEAQSLLAKVVQRLPGLMFNITRPAQPRLGGYHPGSDVPIPDWCDCGHCREMPTEEERVCCQKESCMSQIPDFDRLVLDEGVLSLARAMRRDIIVFEDADETKANRDQAYRQYLLWSYGSFRTDGRSFSRVIPSCCAWRIRDKFPDPFALYNNFDTSI